MCPRTTQISGHEFLAELQNNPVLAAALAPPFHGGNLGEEPGEQALRDVCRRREGARCSDDQKYRAQGELGPWNSKDWSKSAVNGAGPWDGEVSRSSIEGVGPCDAKEPSQSAFTWPEFVSVFLPLGKWEADELEGSTEEGGRGSKEVGGRRGNEGGSGRDKGEEGRGDREEEGGVPLPLVGVADGLGEGELQLLRVAFATVAGRGFDDGTVSLTELRAASAELDGEEPPEEPVRKALQVNSRRFVLRCQV